MNDKKSLKTNVRQHLEKGEYLNALAGLDELAISDNGCKLAKRLYRTYRPQMLEQASRWADEVIRWADEHLLTPKEIINKDIWQEMEQFERGHGVKIEDAYVPKNILKAQKIIEAEKRVCPYAMKREEIDFMEEMRGVDDFKNDVQSYNQNSMVDEWRYASESEKIKLLRNTYKKDNTQLKKVFTSWRNLHIEIRKTLSETVSDLIHDI